MNGLKPKLMQGCVHVHEAEDVVVTGQTPSSCSGSMGSLCAHFSIHCTPTGCSFNVCVRRRFERNKKRNSDVTSEDLVGKTFPVEKKLKVPLTRLLPLLVQNHDADFLFLAFVSGQLKVLLCDLAVIVAAVRVLRARRLAVT